ncbi:CD209 antigen-like isoform X2 [Cheilinus undulatus]|uniref:CD209 antigen-like isoform X2 n=1 Tax=Cheilinus undulatus TaxID=241271 RepID=UPI001BD22D67|nr:CD209 antigen-like isoform X2 [Cheilinus undulatus]
MDLEIEDSTDMTKNLKKKGLVTKGDLHRRAPSSRSVSVFLGLLCVLLLAGNVGQFLFYHFIFNPKSMEQIQAGAAERSQLKANYSFLKQEMDQLQTNYSSLEQERDQLQTNYRIVKQERDQLQTNYRIVKQERDQLQTNYSSLEQEKDQLQTNYSSLKQGMDQLRTDYNSLTAVRDQLQQRVNKMDRSCPPGWSKFGESCFHVSNTTRSWNSSRSFCNSNGGDLAIINTKDKMVFVRGLVDSGNHVWIGLNDRVSEGTWMWVDGTRATTTQVFTILGAWAA